MVNGYVNTETNYFMDNRLNLLNESTYNIANKCNTTTTTSNTTSTGNTGITNSFANKNNTNNENRYNSSSSSGSNNQNDDQLFASNCCAATADQQAPNTRGHTLIDILRVYYEFGPMVCGLVNLIDFVPKFYFTKPNSASAATQSNEAPISSTSGRETPEQNAFGECSGSDSKPRVTEKIAPTESLTRLIRRSLAWFESERKRTIAETGCGNNPQQQLIEDDSIQPIQYSTAGSSTLKPVNLRVCNLQVYQKTILKNQLIQINPTNALQSIDTRCMVHKSVAYGPAVVCQQCPNSSSDDPVQNWCQHVHQLSQPYHLKFVRLAYVVPVYNRYALSICSLKSPLRINNKGDQNNLRLQQNSRTKQDAENQSKTNEPIEVSSSSSSSSDSEDASSEYSSPFLLSTKQHKTKQTAALTAEQHAQKMQSNYDTDGAAKMVPLADKEEEEADQSSSMADSSIELDRKTVEHLLDGKEEELTKKAALDIVNSTNVRHKQDEEANQLNTQNDNGLNDSPIGQLTYRLFAPCQLVNSSSCFSINPVNSSSPLARRGSVDLNGSGISSENAQPSTYLLGNQSAASEMQQVVTSFGAFFPALSHDIAAISGVNNGNSGCQFGGNVSSSGIHSSIESASLNNSNSNKSSSTGQAPTSGNSRFTTNEFESVEAIRRRMEIYVTTNSMKVIAGETLIVNLSDVLSCLSTAIEQTVSRASFGQRRSTSWVSVYILYAAVEEPQLPDQLLAQQKLRGLTLIDECTEENENENHHEQNSNNKHQLRDDLVGSPSKIDSLFDDDFKGSFDNNVTENDGTGDQSDEKAIKKSQQEATTSTTATTATTTAATSGQIRVEQNPNDSSLTLYNSAYDRTVALPTQPDNHLDISEPFECQTDCLWLNENDVIEALVDQMAHQAPDNELESRKRRKKKKKKKSKKQHEDSQCSIM